MDTLARIVGIFNVFVGLMLTTSLLMYVGGMVTWATRLGTWPSYRTEAIRLLEWAVATLFVLDVLLMIVQFIQKNPNAKYVVSVVVILCIIGAVIYISTHGEEKEEKK